MFKTNNRWRWWLRLADGRVIARSHISYFTALRCLDDIKMVQKVNESIEIVSLEGKNR